MNHSIVPISPSTHVGKFWRQPPTHNFAATHTVIPLGLNEVPAATLTFPMALLPINGVLNVVGLCGVDPGYNLMLGPTRKWMGFYEPAAYRLYPFSLAPMQDGALALCIDQAADVMTSIDGGRPFFDINGQLTEEVRQRMEALVMAEKQRAAAVAACAMLNEFGLVKPWNVRLETPKGIRQLDGLLYIDEQAFNALDDDKFIQLRKCGGLTIAYCQMLAANNMSNLARLASVKQPTTNLVSAPPMELDFSRFGA